MAKAESLKKFNTVTGVLLTSLGVISFLIAAWIATHPAPPKPLPVNLEPITDQDSCRGTFSKLGFVAYIKDGEIYVSEYDIQDPQASLARASLGLSLCKSMSLKTFCMGEASTDACQSQGLAMVLKGGGKMDVPKAPPKPATPAPTPNKPALPQ